MAPTSLNYRFTPEKLLLLLVLVTVVVLVFRAPLLETRIVIMPGSGQVSFALDSDVQDGGNTQSHWIDKDQLSWRCTLGEDWPYPFCAMQIYFSDSYLDGVNLSRYTHLNLSLSYQGDAQSLRVFMRNSHPDYTKPNEIRSTKFNMIELDTRKGPEYNDIQLSYFRVADWWLQLYHLDVWQSHTDFSNIGLIEIQSGTGLTEGEHNFTLKRLELVGLRISVEQLYLGIIVVWIIAILLYLASRIRILTLAVQAGKERQLELTEINALLDQRSRTLEEKVKMDPLTGAYNRAGIEGSLKEAFHNWKYNRKPLSLLLLDVDNFKIINDTHGHAVGDEILRELTHVVSNNIRADDHFARWGGEEFIIVSGNTGLQPAYDMAEKLRRLIDEHEFTQSLKVTVSIGVAQIQRSDSLEALFERTDKALYKAKNAGRNQVQAG